MMTVEPSSYKVIVREAYTAQYAIRLLFVTATRFKFNGPMPSLPSGFGVADPMKKRDGFIAAFSRSPAAVRSPSPITQPKNLPWRLGSRPG
jgi:hypothetical protein